MDYYKMLNMMVENSKLTLKEITAKCEKYGVSINPSYISKLKTKKQPPASDEVNKAIAYACGYSEEIDDFLYAAYLERAPEYIREFLILVIAYFREVTKFSLLSMENNEEKLLYEKYLNSLSDYQILKKSIKELGGNEHHIEAEEEYSDVKTLKVSDTLMEPVIPEGALVHIGDSEDIKNGDIVAIEYNGEKLVRKIIFYEENVILTSFNNEQEPVVTTMDGLTIIGKVTFITKKI